MIVPEELKKSFHRHFRIILNFSGFHNDPKEYACLQWFVTDKI
jgi:hypothetical protein